MQASELLQKGACIGKHTLAVFHTDQSLDAIYHGDIIIFADDVDVQVGVDKKMVLTGSEFSLYNARSYYVKEDTTQFHEQAGMRPLSNHKIMRGVHVPWIEELLAHEGVKTDKKDTPAHEFVNEATRAAHIA